MGLALIQVIFWSSLLLYKIFGSSPRSTCLTISWVLVRGNFNCSILDNISCACCALVCNQQIASVPEQFYYIGDAVSVRPTDAYEPAPPRDPLDQ